MFAEEATSEEGEATAVEEYTEEEAGAEEEYIEFNPSDVELFLQRSEIWDKLVLNKITMDEALKLLNTLQNQRSITEAEKEKKSRRVRKTK